MAILGLIFPFRFLILAFPGGLIHYEDAAFFFRKILVISYSGNSAGFLALDSVSIHSYDRLIGIKF